MPVEVGSVELRRHLRLIEQLQVTAVRALPAARYVSHDDVVDGAVRLAVVVHPDRVRRPSPY